jgi:hypothetical protein
MSAAAQELAPDFAEAGFEVEPGPGGGGTPAAAAAEQRKAQQEAARTSTGRRIIRSLVSSVQGSAFRLLQVNPEIDPEPDEAERRAILAALEAAKAEEPSLDPYRTRWRESCVDESPDASDGWAEFSTWCERPG